MDRRRPLKRGKLALYFVDDLTVWPNGRVIVGGKVVRRGEPLETRKPPKRGIRRTT